jgi:hypothetical protein
MREIKFEVIFLEGGFIGNHLLFQKGKNVFSYNMCVFVELTSEMVDVGMCLQRLIKCGWTLNYLRLKGQVTNILYVNEHRL